MPQIPMLDIAAFRNDPSSTQARRFIDDLLAACHGPGFVYLTGHGVAPAIEQAARDAVLRFFDLPEHDRKALAIENSAAFRGYTVLGDEQTAGSSDWRDQLDFGPEQAAPAPDAVPAWLRLRGPNQWPTQVPEMQPAVLAWLDAMLPFALDAIRALALGLGQPIDHFDAGFVPDSDVHGKLIRYPAQPGSATHAGQGVGAHSDSGLLTFILQDDVGGLQVEFEGEFIDAPPIAGSYIMNLGEMLQRATNGYLKATRHRVVSPSADRDRISMAYFFNPRFDSTFEDLDLPAHIAAAAPGGATAGVDNPVYRLFGENNLKVRLRSHPDVAARHYADVL